MKAKIHPEYNPIVFECSCGNKIETSSCTKSNKLNICSACHPFYTGKEKVLDSAGRIEKFRQKYSKFSKKN